MSCLAHLTYRFPCLPTEEFPGDEADGDGNTVSSWAHSCVCLLPCLPTEEEFPGMKQIETATLHRGVAGARHAFIPLPPAANKLDLLLQVCIFCCPFLPKG